MFFSLSMSKSSAFAFILFASLLSACGGDSNVGKQSDADPVAEAGVFGSNIETTGTINVRSGSDVLLSGQNSQGIDDPILNFSWKQVDESAYQVDLFERTSAAVVFTAPNIPLTETNGVELEFELEIEDADSKKDTDRVIVRVLPAGDRNHFLSRPMNNETYSILVVADEGVVLNEDVPITVSLTHIAEWTDRLGENRALTLEEKSLRGTVPSGAVGNITDKSNEYFIEPVPLLDADEINKSFQAELRQGRLEFENVEQANLMIELSVAQQASGDLRLYIARNGELGIELIDTSEVEQGFNRLRFSEEWLRQQINIESRRSANNYYKCIDPNDEAMTLNAWIENAGFNDPANEVHHTTYVNNYDLNFGRDMYIRQDENGNIYSYVINSPTLENSLSGRNDFATVVMEFSPAPTGNCGDGTFAEQNGKKIVKFYAYVPDETTGEYVRAPTMNFDGRGERALPGVCIACHFGDANADEFNVADYRTVGAEAADLDSSFMIWDLDAFLYTRDDSGGQSDRVYQANEISAEITEIYSREAQEAGFRMQNQMALHTFTYDINQLHRFETPIKLLHGLYQNDGAVEQLNFGSEEAPLSESELLELQAAVSTLPANNFDGENYTQPGWVGQEELYHRVFARNCRLCHAQIGERSIDFESYEEFINNERLVPYVYEQGLMPLSRLTMDRFWTDFYGDQSAAEYLRDHLNGDTSPSNDVPANLLPGAPLAIVSPEQNTETEADVVIDFNDSVLFDGTESLFSDSFQWRVEGQLVATDKKFLFEPQQPGETIEIEFLALNSESFIASETLTRSVLVRNNAPNISNVPSQSIVEGEQLTFNLFSLLCPVGAPDSEDCRSIFGDITEGDTPSIDVLGTPINGQIDSVNSATGELVFSSTASELQGPASFDFTLSDSFGEASEPLTMNITVNSLSGPQIGGPDTCTTDARSFANDINYPITFSTVDCPAPSENDTVADGLSLSIVSVNGDNLQAGGSVIVSNGQIEYQPGRFFVGQDSFEYTVQDDSLSAKTSTGTVTVTVEAEQSFAQLRSASGVFGATGDAGCADCHTGSLVGAPNWLNVANVQLAAINTNTQPYGAAELTLEEPTTTEALLDSILFKQACNFDGLHPGGNRLCVSDGAPTAVNDLNSLGRSILQWIEEGARDN